MAEELGSAFIELGAKVPSASDVQHQVDETQRMYREAIARETASRPSFDIDDPGVAALRAQIAARHAESRAATAAARGPGWMSAADALASGQFGGGTPSTSNPAFSMPKWINPPGKEKSDLEKQRDALQEALRPIRMKEEVRGLEKELAKSNTAWGRFTTSFDKVMMATGLSALGLGTAAALGRSVDNMAHRGTSFSNPLMAFQFEQAERDSLAMSGRNMSRLEMDNIRRKRQWADAQALPGGIISGAESGISTLWSKIKDEMPWNKLAKIEQYEAKAAKLTSVGAGLNPMLGQWMGSDDLFHSVATASLQTPMTAPTVQEQQIKTLEETTKALEKFAAQINATTQSLFPRFAVEVP